MKLALDLNWTIIKDKIEEKSWAQETKRLEAKKNTQETNWIKQTEWLKVDQNFII